MIIFESPTVPDSDTESRGAYTIYLKILLCILLRIMFIALNIVFVNQSTQYILFAIWSVGVCAGAEVLGVVGYKLKRMAIKNKVYEGRAGTMASPDDHPEIRKQVRI
jgi:hypothetical protein